MITVMQITKNSNWNDEDFSFTVGDVRYWTGEMFKEFIVTRYASRTYLSPIIYDIPDEDESGLYNRFKLDYQNWLSRNSSNYKRLFDGFLEEYNPLENYDRKEDGNITVTMSRAERTGESYAKQNATNSEQRYVYGDNSAEQVPSETNVQSVTYTDANGDKASYRNSAYVDSDTTAYNGHRIHGNIGVTTPAQMLSGELELRFKDLYGLMFDNFISEYTFYV